MEIFSAGTAHLWTNPHIARQMLAAHLDATGDRASRNHAFIKRSVNWIHQLIAPDSTILDLGCGPGLYATALQALGHQVTGIDISAHSIEYARQQAQQNGLAIQYLCQDYSTINYHEQFNLALLIFCDYGVLAPTTKRDLLQKIWQSLRPGGRLILDVFTLAYFTAFQQTSSTKAASNGFWSAEPYEVVEVKRKYEKEKVILESYKVIQQDQQQTYLIWQQCYDPDQLRSEVLAAGFQKIALYSDVAGTAHDIPSPTLAIVATKAN